MSWIRQFRDDPNNREPNRINGRIGKGPFKLSARKKILEKLFTAQAESGLRLISQEELDYIRKKWKLNEISKFAME